MNIPTPIECISEPMLLTFGHEAHLRHTQLKDAVYLECKLSILCMIRSALLNARVDDSVSNRAAIWHSEEIIGSLHVHRAQDCGH